MAVLSDPERAALWAEFMRANENINNGAGVLTKAQLRAAIDAVDQWCEDNATAFNTAIPQPARGALTSRQKAALLVYVTKRRWELS
jgi:hypothetical protein